MSKHRVHIDVEGPEGQFMKWVYDVEINNDQYHIRIPACGFRPVSTIVFFDGVALDVPHDVRVIAAPIKRDYGGVF